MKLIPGTVEAVYKNDTTSELYRDPVFQVLAIKKFPVVHDPSKTFLRITLSDSKFSMYGILSSTLSSLVEGNKIQPFCLIRIKQFSVSTSKNRIIVIIKSVSDEILQQSQQVGQPVLIEKSEESQDARKSLEEHPEKRKEPETRSRIQETKEKKPRIEQEPLEKASLSSSAPTVTNKIASLNPFLNSWTIRARVTAKSDVRKFTNARGEGKLFSVNLLDESGEIKATAFSEAVDIFHPLLEVNKVYFISRARVQVTKKQYNTLGNDYELQLDRTTSIVQCLDDDKQLPAVRYNFVKVSSLSGDQKGGLVDVIGVVTEVSELQSITTKAQNRNLEKRDVTLADTSGKSIKMTLWGQFAIAEYDGAPILAAKNVRVSDFGGVSLSTVSDSIVVSDPELKEAYELREWYDSGKGKNVSSMTGAGTRRAPLTTIAATQEQQFGTNRTEIVSVIGTIILTKTDTLSYPACLNKECNKKVVQEDSNAYRCERCDRVYESCDYRYVFKLCIAEHSGQLWASVFNEAGESIIGRSALEMQNLRQESEEEYLDVLRQACFKQFNFTLKFSQEVYNEETRIKVNVLSAEPVSPIQESKRLISILSA